MVGVPRKKFHHPFFHWGGTSVKRKAGTIKNAKGEFRDRRVARGYASRRKKRKTKRPTNKRRLRIERIPLGKNTH